MSLKFFWYYVNEDEENSTKEYFRNYVYTNLKSTNYNPNMHRWIGHPIDIMLNHQTSINLD